MKKSKQKVELAPVVQLIAIFLLFLLSFVALVSVLIGG